MRNLECSSRGDKRFSAFYAQVSVFGIVKSIEEHYQSAKAFYKENPQPRTWRDAKGRRPDFLRISDFTVEPKYLTAYYLILWAKYFMQHRDLLEYARTFDTFSDMFAKGCINSQADAIAMIAQQGLRPVLTRPDVSELMFKLDYHRPEGEGNGLQG